MSKQISIKEGSMSKQFTAKKLKTHVVGGGTCLWVPEDETRLTTKHISENGTYEAINDGYYGYSQVTVSGIGQAVGTMPVSTGGDGNEHAFIEGIDPVTGEKIIIDKKLPSSITISRPPTKTEYQDGETIDITGIFVIAHYADGTQYIEDGVTDQDGKIPISALEIDPKVAAAEGGDEWSDGDGINAVLLTTRLSEPQYDGERCYLTEQIGENYKEEFNEAYIGCNAGGIKLLATQYNDNVYVRALDANNVPPIVYYNNNTRNVYKVSYHGSFYYYGNYHYNVSYDKFTNMGNMYVQKSIFLPESTKDPNEAGELHPTSQKITVSWQRFGDKKELSDTFEITVGEGS